MRYSVCPRNPLRGVTTGEGNDIMAIENYSFKNSKISELLKKLEKFVNKL